MTFPKLKRAHRLRMGDQVKVLIERETHSGKVDQVINRPTETWVWFDNGEHFQLPRNQHVEILNK